MSRYGFERASNAAPLSQAAPVVATLPQVRPFQTVLEARYPHILDAIQAMWGYKELNTYFRRLTLDDRGGRAGFPPEAWEEIHALQLLHQMIVPELSFA
jgi:hypothetical protein